MTASSVALRRALSPVAACSGGWASGVVLGWESYAPLMRPMHTLSWPVRCIPLGLLQCMINVLNTSTVAVVGGSGELR